MSLPQPLKRYTESDLERARIDAKGEALRWMHYLLERLHTQAGDFGEGQRYEIRLLDHQVCTKHKEVTGEGLGNID